MNLADRKRRVPPVVAPSAGEDAPPPTSAAEAPAPAAPVVPPADVPPRRQGMTEDRARRLARERNAERKPGEPIWTPWRLQQPDGRLWDVGTVPPYEPRPVGIVRDWDELLG